MTTMIEMSPSVKASFPLPKTEALPVRAVKSDKKRLVGVDAGRVIASLAVVWLHVTAVGSGDPTGVVSLWGGESLGRFGMRFFTFISVILIGETLRRDTSRSFLMYVQHRFRRIYVPFLIWAVIYFALSVLRRLYFHQPITIPNWSMILTGRVYHLWFLPFAFAYGIAAFAFLKSTASLKDGLWRKVIGIACLLAGVAVAIIYSRPYGTLMLSTTNNSIQDAGYWLIHVIAALPALMWGLGLVCLVPNLKEKMSESRVLTLISLCIWAITVCLVQFVGRYSILVNAAAVAFGLAALGNWKFSVLNFVAGYGRHAFGIYLIHPAFLITLVYVVFHGQPISSIWVALGLFGIAAGGSLLVSILLCRSKYTSWLIT